MADTCQGVFNKKRIAHPVCKTESFQSLSMQISVSLCMYVHAIVVNEPV